MDCLKGLFITSLELCGPILLTNLVHNVLDVVVLDHLLRMLGVLPCLVKCQGIYVLDMESPRKSQSPVQLCVLHDLLFHKRLQLWLHPHLVCVRLFRRSDRARLLMLIFLQDYALLQWLENRAPTLRLTQQSLLLF